MANTKTKSSSKVTENQVAKLARSATGSAYRRAMRTGDVLVYRNAELHKVESSGKVSVVKKLEPRVRIAKGSKFELEPKSA